MSKSPIFIVDAFVGQLGERVLRGNPAAVVLLESKREAVWMQTVAAEMNLSETAFVVPMEDGEDDFELRWFTPRVEVKLCGHATLAAAHVLWESGRLDAGTTASFHTYSGILTASCEGEWIEMDFPSQETTIVPAPPDLALALGLGPNDPVAYLKAEDDWMLKIAANKIEAIKPNFVWLEEVSRKLRLRGVIVTAAAPKGAPYDFSSRFFGPAVGIDEDPVTGSAHTKLAPFWGQRFAKSEMIGYQASERGGLLRVVWRQERVGLGGKAVTALRGELLI